jgi:hypothetical protein
MRTIIKLLASDFKDSDYLADDDCPLARATTRYTGLVMRAGTTYVRDGSTCYEMDNGDYHLDTFTMDEIEARNFNFSSEVVIREIKFIQELPVSAEENPYAMCSND